ncbi:hypothetical protein BC332_19253 [Capsicum chinense]|nr:hypothetical protein BC332_19253 [Capsicum chinense]
MHRPPPYGMSNNGRYPPYHYGGEYYLSERRRGGNVCVRCICCFCCFLFLIILVFAVLILYMFLYYDPKCPTYKFEYMDVKEFKYNPDSSINADVILTLRANNPNKGVGLLYEEASFINVTYSDSLICSGKFPSFHHGHRNVTMLQIALKGKNQLRSGLNESLKDDERHDKIRLKLMAMVPFRLVFGNIISRSLNMNANVTLIVRDLKPGKKSVTEEGKIAYRLSY